ncbi:hypothetical protein D3C80_1576500 [compost metagenome]
MFEGFLEMQSLVTQVHGRLEIGGDQQYRKIEFGTERYLRTPEPGGRQSEQIVESKRRSLRQLFS